MALDLGDPAAPLERFGDSLGIPRTAWAGEGLDEIVAPADTRVTVGALAECQETVVELVEAYGDALETDTGWSKIHGLSEDLELRPGLTRERLDAFLKRVRTDLDDPNEARSFPLALTFRLNKRRLIEDQLGDRLREVRPALLFYPAGLAQLLEGDLSSVEGWWDATAPRRLVLFVPAWEHRLAGPLLAVVGGDPRVGLDRILEPPPAFRRSPRELYDAGRKRLNWQVEWVQHLTPLHLAVSGDAPDADPVARALRVQTGNLCILFTADWTRRAPSGGGRIATYAGPRREVQVALAEPGTYRARLPGTSVEALIELVEWAYGSEIGGDRLSLVQNAVARALEDDGGGNYEALVLRAPSILAEVKTHWKFFLEGRVEEFMGQIQALEDEVSATVQAFSERTSAMIKSLSDTVLGAVATLIGSFIAALVKGETGLLVLWIAVGAYVVYMLAFPLAYNMSQQLQTYRTLTEQFGVRRRRFEERLYEEKVEAIVGDRVRKSRRHFMVWFALTFVAYLAVAGAVLGVVHWVGPRLGPAEAGETGVPTSPDAPSAPQT